MCCYLGISGKGRPDGMPSWWRLFVMFSWYYSSEFSVAAIYNLFLVRFDIYKSVDTGHRLSFSLQFG